MLELLGERGILPLYLMYWGEEIENEETHFPSWPTILFPSKLGGEREREGRKSSYGRINQ